MWQITYIKTSLNYKLSIMNYKLTDVPSWRNDTVLPLHKDVKAAAWAVDAACSGNPGPMEYQGIDLATDRKSVV